MQREVSSRTMLILTGDPLTATWVSGPAHGTVFLNADGSFVYTHDGSETTTDQFVYQIDDGNGVSTVPWSF